MPLFNKNAFRATEKGLETYGLAQEKGVVPAQFQKAADASPEAARVQEK
jgi:hypothetical protein